MVIQKIRLSEYQLADYNPRIMTQKALDGLKTSLDTFGLVEPLIVNSRSKRVVGGHQRYRILMDSNVSEVEAVIVDLDEFQEKALNITLNNTKIQGEWDQEKLDEILNELREVEFPNFDDLELGELESPDFDENRLLENTEFEGGLDQSDNLDPKTCPNCGHPLEN